MLDAAKLMKAFGINPEELKKPIDEFKQIMEGIGGNLNILRAQNKMILRNQERIMSHLGIQAVTDETPAIAGTPADPQSVQ